MVYQLNYNLVLEHLYRFGIFQEKIPGGGGVNPIFILVVVKDLTIYLNSVGSILKTDGRSCPSRDFFLEKP